MGTDIEVDAVENRLAEMAAEIATRRAVAEQAARQCRRAEASHARLADTYATLRRLMSRGLDDDPDPPPASTPGTAHPAEPPAPLAADLAGRTAWACAEAILAERALDSLHYREIAAEAVRRGYRSPTGRDDAANVERCFWDALRRAKARPGARVAMAGGGRFCWIGKREKL